MRGVRRHAIARIASWAAFISSLVLVVLALFFAGYVHRWLYKEEVEGFSLELGSCAAMFGGDPDERGAAGAAQRDHAAKTGARLERRNAVTRGFTAFAFLAFLVGAWFFVSFVLDNV